MTLKAQKPIYKAYPEHLKTLGDYLRKERLDRGLLQKDVAKILKVITPTIVSWELNHKTPTPRCFKSIISFLGYCPFWNDNLSLGRQLYYSRLMAGKTQEQLSKKIKCEEAHIQLFEKKERKPLPAEIIKIKRFIENMKSQFSFLFKQT